MELDETTCPYCAEIIKAAAIKCRWCGEMLGTQTEPRLGDTPLDSAPAPEPGARHDWTASSAYWRTAFDSVPQERSLKKSGFSRYVPGYKPADLQGKALVDICAAYGRPDWWTAEPATGGAMAGWREHAAIAIHVNDDGSCDKLLQRAPNELDLSWALRRLGNLLGKPLDVVVQHLGAPNSRGGGAGYTLLQWMRPGYHIALKFDRENQCLGITHQHVARPVGR